MIPGVSVAVTSAMGKGFPDIIVGRKLYGGSILALVELKDGKKSASKKRLTHAEEKFKSEWEGFYHVCENLEQILKIIGL